MDDCTSTRWGRGGGVFCYIHELNVGVEDARGFDSSARGLPFDIKGLDG